MVDGGLVCAGAYRSHIHQAKTPSGPAQDHESSRAHIDTAAVGTADSRPRRWRAAVRRQPQPQDLTAVPGRAEPASRHTGRAYPADVADRSEEHTSELQSRRDLV